MSDAANPLESVSNYLLAIGALGTAAFALVDSTKAFAGGVSNHGFRSIDNLVARLVPRNPGKDPLGSRSLRAVLRANWLHGMDLEEQKTVARNLIKLHLTPATAPHLADDLGLSEADLTEAAAQVGQGNSLTGAPAQAWSRFDLIVATLTDEAYHRADQTYRNSAKAWALVVAVLLALGGGYLLDPGAFSLRTAGISLVVGLLATPLAPVAKDLTSALQSAVKALGFLKR